MTEQEYSELEPLYQQAKTEVLALPHINITAVIRLYRIGYNRAVRLIAALVEHGYLKYNNFDGGYSRIPTSEESR